MTRAGSLLAAALLLASPSPAERWAPGDHELSLAHGGRERHALVYVPPAAAGDAPLPLVLSFHGGGGEAAAHRAWSGLDRVAAREGFVAAYPFGTGRLGERRLLTWNAGTCCGSAQREGVDDVGFVVALLEAIAARTPIDATRVYATGLSNGAMLAFRLAHDAGVRFAGIGTVGGVARFAPFQPAAPMPIVHFHSTDDPRAPFAGGPGPRFPFGVRVQHAPVEATLDDWGAANGCPKHALRRETRTAPPDRFDAGHTATLLAWTPCASGAPILLWRLTGAGHVWPGAPPRYSERLLGAPTRVVDASEELWRALSAHRRADAPPLGAPRSPDPTPAER